MTSPLRRPLSAALLALAALLLAAFTHAPAAHASKSEEVTFEAPRDLFDAGKREAAFDEIGSLGAHALRIVLYWKDVAPDADSRVKPRLDMTDPSVYDWSKYQPVLDEAHARGWTVQVTATGPVPRWATNGAVDTVTRPSPNEFRMFMTALSKHFGPEVARWSIWNEPNHPQFLLPQYDSKHRPVSPKVYRGLYAAALRGLAAAGDTKPVLMGETAPTGTGKDVAPLTFLRGALCLSDSYKMSKGCVKLRVDGYAHHAYTTRSGPTYKPPGPNDVMIGSLSRLVTALDKAAKAGAVAKSLPIYLTEFGIQSTPDPVFGVSFQRQAEYRSYAERLAYYNPRVKAFSQYLLTDDLPVAGKTGAAKYGGFESGLRTSAGKEKDSYVQVQGHAVGPGAPGQGRREGGRAGAPVARRDVHHRQDRHHQLEGLLDAERLARHLRARVARALDRPERQDLHRSPDPRDRVMVARRARG
jgi:hypothetical protein